MTMFEGCEIMNKVENPIFRPSALIAAICYAVMYLIGSALLLIMVAKIFSSFHPEYSFSEVYGCLSTVDPTKLSQEMKHVYAVVSAFGNLLSYVVMLLLVAFYMRHLIRSDWQALKSNWKKMLVFIPLTCGAFYGLTYLIDYLVSLANTEVSTNQSSIILMISEGSMWATFFAVVICAPLVEELIYRKAIFSLAEKKPIIISYVISVILFTLPHMLTTPFDNPGTWFLLSLNYACSAVLLCFIYHFSGKNFYASWAAHLVNNLIAFIIIASQI